MNRKAFVAIVFACLCACWCVREFCKAWLATKAVERGLIRVKAK